MLGLAFRASRLWRSRMICREVGTSVEGIALWKVANSLVFFFSLNSHLPGHMEICFDDISGMRTFKSWGDEPEMRVQQWRKTTGRIRHVRPTVKGVLPIYETMPNFDLWGCRRIRQIDDEILGISGFFWVLLCGSFPRSLASQVAWWSTSMRKIRPRGWTWRKSWVQGTWQIPCTNHTSNPFPVLFFFFRVVYNIVISVR